MRPARQRLDADNAVARGVHDRLIGGADSVVLDGVEQVAFEQFAAGQVGVHRRVIDAGAVAAFVLGAIERHVGIAQNVGGIAGAAVDDGNADRGADDDVVAADRIGRAERIDDAAGDSLQRVGIGLAGGDDGELVAAEPGDQIVAAHDAAQPLRDIENERVADVMAERIVDVLEVIEIDVEDRGRSGRRRAHSRSRFRAARRKHADWAGRRPDRASPGAAVATRRTRSPRRCGACSATPGRPGARSRRAQRR